MLHKLLLSTLALFLLPLAAPAATVEELNARVDQLIQELPKVETHSGKDMKSKLGLLYIMGNTESPAFYEAARSGLLPIVKTGSQSSDRGNTTIEHNPDAWFIVSGGQGIDYNSQTPQEAAQIALKVAKEHLGHVPDKWEDQVHYLEVTPCMWEPKDAESGLWYSEFLIEFLPEFSKLGPRPIVLNSGVGGLPIEPSRLGPMVPGLRLAHHLGGAWGCHGYTIKYTKDLNEEIWLSLRYRQAYDYFKEHAPELMTFPMILLEGGVDDKGNELKDGWLARGSLEKFADWLEWYDSELMKDDYVLGVTLFKIGAPSIWESFEMEPVVPWMIEHYKEAHGMPADKEAALEGSQEMTRDLQKALKKLQAEAEAEHATQE